VLQSTHSADCGLLYTPMCYLFNPVGQLAPQGGHPKRAMTAPRLVPPRRLAGSLGLRTALGAATYRSDGSDCRLRSSLGPSDLDIPY
jgi:hypothetical protein